MLLLCTLTLLLLANHIKAAAARSETNVEDVSMVSTSTRSNTAKDMHDILHDNDNYDDKSFMERLAQFFSRRCLKNDNQQQLEKLEAELRSLPECFLKVLPKHTHEDDEHLTEMCLKMTHEVAECMERLLEALKPCLERKESYVPEFVMESYRNYSHYFCHHVKILTVEGLLDSNMAKCINRFMKHKNTNPHNICYAAVQISVESRDTAITKDELCHDLDLVYLCYEEIFKEKCPNAPKAWEFQAGLLDAMRSPCPKELKNELHKV